MAAYRSVIPVIEAKYDSLTQSEKRIADYFFEMDDADSLSVEELSETLGVSEATISRFARKCGFRGYREFIYEYMESVAQKQYGKEDAARTVMNTYEELMNRTTNLVDAVQIERIADRLTSCRRAIACGIGSSGLAAREMESRFMRIGVDIDALSDADRIRMQTVFLDPSVLVFGLSISGRTEPVQYLLKEAHSHGAGTILITTNDKTAFHTYCDEIVLTASTRHLEAGDTISPQFPILLIVDLIYAEYVRRDRRKRTAMHGDTVRALLRNGDREAPASQAERKI